MNELKLFENPEFGSLRTIEKDGEPWFVAVDICNALEIGNARQAVTRLDDDEKSTVISNDGHQLNIVSESGLYSLVLSSRKKEAKAFKRWVTHEVIPSIRKHGAYMTEDTLAQAIANPDFAIGLLNALKTEQKKNKLLETQIVMQNQQIAELKPRADYTDKILKNKGLVTITQIAKDYGMSAQQMNKKLYELGVQYKQSKQWLLYSRYHDKGYTHSETINITRSDGRPDIQMETKWTQKGRLFIYARLRSVGILPIIEREIDETYDEQ